MPPETTGQKQVSRDAHGRFKKGWSGNRNGRPLGARHKTTLAVEAMLEGEAEILTRAALDLAKGAPGHDGDAPIPPDLTALRLCLERILPPRRDRLIALELPPMRKPSDLPELTGAIVDAVARGEITTREAAELSKLVENHRRALETVDIEERLSRLEHEHRKSSRQRHS